MFIISQGCFLGTTHNDAHNSQTLTYCSVESIKREGCEGATSLMVIAIDIVEIPEQNYGEEARLWILFYKPARRISISPAHFN